MGNSFALKTHKVVFIFSLISGIIFGGLALSSTALVTNLSGTLYSDKELPPIDSATNMLAMDVKYALIFFLCIIFAIINAWQYLRIAESIQDNEYCRECNDELN